MKLYLFIVVFISFISLVSARRKICPVEYEIHCSEMKEKCIKEKKFNCDMVQTGCLTSHKCNRVHKKKQKKPLQIEINGISLPSFK